MSEYFPNTTIIATFTITNINISGTNLHYVILQIFGIEMLDNVDTGLRKKIVTIGPTRKEELTVCTVKTGLNDFLDYITLSVTLLLPAGIGLFQGRSRLQDVSSRLYLALPAKVKACDEEEGV